MICLTGNLARDPEDRGKVTTFAIAVRNSKQDGDVAFIGCKAFGDVKDIVDGLGKGETVDIAGKFRTDKWEDKKGNDRSILVFYVEMIKPWGKQSKKSSSKKTSRKSQHDDDDQGGDDGEQDYSNPFGV